MKIKILILLVALYSCYLTACNSNNQPVVNADSSIAKTPIDTPACIIVPKPPLTAADGSGSTPNPIVIEQVRVILKLKEFKPADFPGLKTSADSALHIASVLLNCKQFQDTLKKMDFSCRNYSSYCRSQCTDCGGRFPGQRVLDSAYRQKEVFLDLYLRNCHNEFGHSSKNILEIYSCQPVIAVDERSLPFAHSYAYHLAHEYMHVVGYFHFDHGHQDDVAERVGWVGWDIMLQWKKAGIDPMKVVL